MLCVYCLYILAFLSCRLFPFPAFLECCDRISREKTLSHFSRHKVTQFVFYCTDILFFVSCVKNVVFVVFFVFVKNVIFVILVINNVVMNVIFVILVINVNVINVNVINVLFVTLVNNAINITLKTPQRVIATHWRARERTYISCVLSR